MYYLKDFRCNLQKWIGVVGFESSWSFNMYLTIWDNLKDFYVLWQNQSGLSQNPSIVGPPYVKCLDFLVSEIKASKLNQSFKFTFLSFQGFCMGWNRIFIALPVQPYKWPAAALWNCHLREEEKEAEDGPRRPEPSWWEQTSICQI